MSINLAADKVLSEAEAGLQVWKSNAEFKLKDVTLQNFEKSRNALQSTLELIADLECQLSMKLSERDKLEDDLSRMNTRLRSAARGYFGPDSTEYEQLGGTRASTRRKYSRRVAVTTEVAAKA